MKIEVAKRDLEAALGVVSLAASSNGTDITSHFVFRYQPDENVVELLANNNRLGARMPMICDTKVEDDVQAFTVESWRLKQWISAVQDAALVLELTEGQVKATSPRGSVKFPSLDPKLFPYWDKTAGETKPGIKLAARRLHGALSYARMYISDKDTTTPELSVMEVKKGCLQATDRGGLAAVTLRKDVVSQGEEGGKEEIKSEPLLGDSNLRIHSKDLGPVLSFLASCGDETVEIREHDKTAFLLREDGGMLMISRSIHAFPDIALDKDGPDPHWWEVKTEDLRSAINVLAASAAREDHKINFRMEDSMVAVSMSSFSGDRSTLHLEALDHGSEEGEDVVAMPDAGLSLAYPYLNKLLGAYRGETIRFGLHPREKRGKPFGGLVRFREDRDGDDYLSILVCVLA